MIVKNKNYLIRHLFQIKRTGNMTAKELAEELLKHPDFKVKVVYVDYFNDGILK